MTAQGAGVEPVDLDEVTAQAERARERPGDLRAAGNQMLALIAECRALRSERDTLKARVAELEAGIAEFRKLQAAITATNNLDSHQ